jgi:hypothetical protein
LEIGNAKEAEQMTSAKVNELMNLMERGMEERANDVKYQAWLAGVKRSEHFLGKTGVGTWTPEEERLLAELSPDEQSNVWSEISARADGYESLGAALAKEKEDKNDAAKIEEKASLRRHLVQKELRRGAFGELVHELEATIAEASPARREALGRIVEDYRDQLKNADRWWKLLFGAVGAACGGRERSTLRS